jgi:predicted molibdopterin-dependent oxidoreductase YjgC
VSAQDAAQFRRLTPRRGATIGFTIDGRPATASEGDTLLSAILLNVGSLRRFEFGAERRAGFCLMGACQDCWVSLDSGERLRACTSLVRAGMAIVTDARRG